MERLLSKRLSSTAICALALMIIGAGAFFFRVYRLDARPVHTDEAVHMVKASILLEQGVYDYDPHEYHGPTLYYFSMPVLWLTGAKTSAQIPGEWPFLIVTVLFGALLVLLPLFVQDGMGRFACVTAGLLTAVSPAMVFYSRDYIQEILFVTFAFMAIIGMWRYSRNAKLRWAILVGLAAGLLPATKESAIIVYFAWGVAAAGAAAWAWVSEHRWLFHRRIAHWHLAVGLLLALFVVIVALTGGFTHMPAVVDALRSYGNYILRVQSGASVIGGEGVHNHPWWFYMHRLVWYHAEPGPYWTELPIILLACVGMFAAAVGHVPGAHRGFARFIAIYALVLTLVFAVIPYKTPWNLLVFLHPLILCAGMGASYLWHLTESRLARILFVLAAVGCVGLLARRSWQACFVYQADTRNPYVYAQTGKDALRMVRRIEEVAAVSPERRKMVIQVIVPGSDYWPLPWYLRRFANVGYYNAIPEKVVAPVVVTIPNLQEAIEPMLPAKYYSEMFGLRPGVLLTVYIRQDLWDQLVSKRQ